MKINIMKNTESAGFHGSTFGQDVEAAGTYVLEKPDYLNKLIKGWIDGWADIQNPLKISVDDNTRISYKNDLAAQYKAKGKGLTKKLMAAGHDAIVTIEEDGTTGEIILFPNCKFHLNWPTREGKILIKNLLREALNKLNT